MLPLVLVTGCVARRIGMVEMAGLDDSTGAAVSDLGRMPASVFARGGVTKEELACRKLCILRLSA